MVTKKPPNSIGYSALISAITIFAPFLKDPEKNRSITIHLIPGYLSGPSVGRKGICSLNSLSLHNGNRRGITPASIIASDTQDTCSCIWKKP